MPDAPGTSPDPAADRPTGRRSGGLFLAGLVGVGVAGLWAFNRAAAGNAPAWVAFAAFFTPVFLYGLACALLFGTGLVSRVRRAREEVRRGPSPEGAAAAARGEGVEAGTTPSRAGLPPDHLPTVRVADTRPGKVLGHRLGRAGSPLGCQLGCLLGVAAFWNGIVGVFAYQLVGRWNQGGAFRWVEAAFLVPFVLVGVVLVLMVLVTALDGFVAGLVGRVDVELAGHPLAPGRAARVHVAQAGLFPLGRVTVALVCTEKVTYVAGTSTSTEKRQVACHPAPDLGGEPGGLPREFDLATPADAMHSFHAPNNQIVWTVRVAGRVLGMLRFRADFAATVVPPREDP